MDNLIDKLSKEEEKKLILDAQAGNSKAIKRLTDANQGLLIELARKYWNENSALLFEDFISEGKVALLKAIQKFDIGKGYRFSTFAGTCIRNVIINLLKSEKEHVSLDDNKEEISDVRLALMHRQNKEFYAKISQLKGTKHVSLNIEDIAQEIKAGETNGKLHILRYEMINPKGPADNFRHHFYDSDEPLSQKPEYHKLLESMRPKGEVDKILSKWQKRGADIQKVQDAYEFYFTMWLEDLQTPLLSAKKSKRYRSVKVQRQGEKIIKFWKEWANYARKSYLWNAIRFTSMTAFFQILFELNEEIERLRVIDERTKRASKTLSKHRRGNTNLNYLIVSVIDCLYKVEVKEPSKECFRDIKKLIWWEKFDPRERYLTGKASSGRGLEYFKNHGSIFDEKTKPRWLGKGKDSMIEMKIPRFKESLQVLGDTLIDCKEGDLSVYFLLPDIIEGSEVGASFLSEKKILKLKSGITILKKS